MVAQHVEDEALLDGLLHRVGMEWQVFDGAVWLRSWLTEQFEGLVLGRGGESEIARIVEQPVVLYGAVDLVLERVVVVIVIGCFAKGKVHGGGGTPALTGVSFVDDDGEFSSSVFVGDSVHY